VAGIDLGIDLDATNAASDAAVAGDAASSQDDGGVDAAKCRGYTVYDVTHLGDGRGGSSGDAVSAGHRIVADHQAEAPAASPSRSIEMPGWSCRSRGTSKGIM
jgi:hypothetical protein